MGENEGEETNAISINIRTHRGDLIPIKLKKETLMAKVYKAVAQNQGIPENSFRLMLDGQRLSPPTSIKMAEIEDGDQMYVT
jgi:hypothetical protein